MAARASGPTSSQQASRHRSRRSSSPSVGAVGSSSTTSRPSTRHRGGSVSSARGPSSARPRVRSRMSRNAGTATESRSSAPRSGTSLRSGRGCQPAGRVRSPTVCRHRQVPSGGPAAQSRALPAPQGSNEQGLALTLPRRSCPAVLMEIEPAGKIPPPSSGPARPNEGQVPAVPPRTAERSHAGGGRD